MTQPIIQSLTQTIINSEIKEANRDDSDYLLQGYLEVLQNLLAKFPMQKDPIGKQLLKILLHDGLFEVPHGTKGASGMIAPKCKNRTTRQ
jgi:hypothetical protein